MKPDWLLVLVCTLLLTYASPASVAGVSNKGVVHTVFLWLKQPGDQQHRQQLLRATERLRAIPGVLDIRFGQAIASDRDIVDDSFDVGIYFYFNDVGAMNRYLSHPVHARVLDRDIKPVVKRIVVHDFHDTKIR